MVRLWLFFSHSGHREHRGGQGCGLGVSAQMRDCVIKEEAAIRAGASGCTQIADSMTAQDALLLKTLSPLCSLWFSIFVKQRRLDCLLAQSPSCGYDLGSMIQKRSSRGQLEIRRAVPGRRNARLATRSSLTPSVAFLCTLKTFSAPRERRFHLSFSRQRVPRRWKVFMEPFGSWKPISRISSASLMVRVAQHES